jgi:KTSC domain
MRRVSVDSSAVTSVGYDTRTRTLEVEFEGGGVYRYLGVPAREHATLMRADSLGTYVNRRIKPYYRCLKVT